MMYRVHTSHRRLDMLTWSDGWPLCIQQTVDVWFGRMFGAILKWVWINTYENTIFRGMNIHKSQLFWGSLGTRVLTHPQGITSEI